MDVQEQADKRKKAHRGRCRHSGLITRTCPRRPLALQRDHFKRDAFQLVWFAV